YLTGWVGERILADLRIGLFRHLQRLSLGFYERTRAGVIISRLTNDVEAIDQLVTDGVTSLVQNTLTLVGTAILLFVLDWRLALARGGARLRRPSLLQRRRHARNAVRVHALRAELLRPGAAALAAVQHVPLRDGCTRQDHGRHGRGPGGARPARSATAAARGR